MSNPIDKFRAEMLQLCDNAYMEGADNVINTIVELASVHDDKIAMDTLRSWRVAGGARTVLKQDTK